MGCGSLRWEAPLVFVDVGVKISETSHGVSARLVFCRQVEWRSAVVFADFIAYEKWPSNSPDLNPLDFLVWSVVEHKMSAARRTTCVPPAAPS